MTKLPHRIDIPIDDTDPGQLMKHVIWLTKNIKNGWSQDSRTGIDAALDDLLAGRTPPPMFVTYWFEKQEDGVLFRLFNS